MSDQPLQNDDRLQCTICSTQNHAGRSTCWSCGTTLPGKIEVVRQGWSSVFFPPIIVVSIWLLIFMLIVTESKVLVWLVESHGFLFIVLLVGWSTLTPFLCYAGFQSASNRQRVNDNSAIATLGMMLNAVVGVGALLLSLLIVLA